ncbi:MAG: hypothetical protein Q8L78_07350 [Coxiellaceae bacterium]|nr:hypothetical protein [Coxiellaceae bacterium]
MRRTLPKFKPQQNQKTNAFTNAFAFFTLFGALTLRLQQLAENKEVLSPKNKNKAPSFFEKTAQPRSPMPGFDGFMPEPALPTFNRK